MDQNELRHYGVKGMKWGVRRYQNEDGTYTSIGRSRRTARLEKKVERQRNVVESWKDSSPIKDKRGKTLYSESDVRDIYEGAKRRLEKLEYKLLISQRMDQINAGTSIVGKIWNKTTGADEIQARWELALEEAARVNPKRFGDYIPEKK